MAYTARQQKIGVLIGISLQQQAQKRPERIKLSVYKGFCNAKDVMADQFVAGMTFNNMATMVPWLTSLLTADRSLLGQDWWPYGIAANRSAIDAVLRYHRICAT